MIENNNFPWYLQQSSSFGALYYGFFPIAETASPLAFGDALNPYAMTGTMLFRIGTYFGMNGTPSFYNGLIYDIDNWSEVKTWTGGVAQIGEELYRNFLCAKAFAFGRLYSTDTLKGVFERIFAGMTADVRVYEAGTIVEEAIDYGYVNEPTEITEDYGNVSAPATTFLDYGDLLGPPAVPENELIIQITASHAVIEAFIEMRGFDLDFIGKPTGVKVNWQYVFTD